MQDFHEYSDEEVNFPEYLYGSEMTIFWHNGIWNQMKSIKRQPDLKTLKDKRVIEVFDDSEPGVLKKKIATIFEKANQMPAEDAIRMIGGSPLALETLYISYRMLKHDFKLYSENTEYAKYLNRGIKMLEGAMYLSAYEEEKKIYIIANKIRGCILSVLVKNKKPEIGGKCIPILEKSLNTMIGKKLAHLPRSNPDTAMQQDWFNFDFIMK
ncbi:MAG: hypothetical protein AAFO09_07980 [Pseudomonadota bacterium]